ncbi:unnamed protein product [Moneuplotes crassus]|uniref:Uncharacterized protein n=1 Tax=Euplotes crassus TaxID=5936 RepID=A0AAD1UNH1_EUPCR|nr:unnamed protein product [Moneuplotes crassus]
MENMPKAIEEKDTQKISLEKFILAKTKKQDITRYQSILYKIFPENREAKPLGSDPGKVPENSELCIHFKDLRDEKFVKSFKHLKFFDINQIWFHYFDSKNRHFVDFLESSFPNKTNYLCFKSRAKMDLNRSNYLSPLLRLSSKVTKEVSFYRFCIGFNQLKRLVAAYRHARVLVLWDCSLSIPSVPDFSKALTNCQIQDLDLIGSGSSNRSDWENSFGQFKNLIQGLASSPNLRSSLKKVDILRCGITQSAAKQIFEENQLGQVKIIGGKKFR